jgi:hypothetical protein
MVHNSHHASPHASGTGFAPALIVRSLSALLGRIWHKVTFSCSFSDFSSPRLRLPSSEPRACAAAASHGVANKADKTCTITTGRNTDRLFAFAADMCVFSY